MKTEKLNLDAGTVVLVRAPFFGGTGSKIRSALVSDLGNPELADSINSLDEGECVVKTPGTYRFHRHK